MPTNVTPEQRSSTSQPRRRRRRRPSFPWGQAVVGVILCAGVIAALAFALKPSSPQVDATPTPPAATVPALADVTLTPAPAPTATPAPTPAPTPEPTPEPTYDFTLPAPETAAVEDGWFSDAVFIGDSRTDGLKLFGGVTGASFIEHTGIMVFETSTRKVIKVGGEKYTVLEALALQQYAKVYLMLGVNELGYGSDNAFYKAYGDMVDSIRSIQPNAVVYVQNLPAINPEVAKKYDTPSYVNNEKIADYNALIAQVAAEKKAVLVDVNAALVGSDGILPKEGTTDGVHFSKSYYVKWYDYLKLHTVDPDLYWAGQTAQSKETGVS